MYLAPMRCAKVSLPPACCKDHCVHPVWCAVCTGIRLKLKPGSTEAEVDILLRDKVVLKPVQELMKFSLIESDEDNYRCGQLADLAG